MAGASRSKSIGCLVLAGEDFPQTAENLFQDWEMTMILKKVVGRSSTRGLLEYGDTTFGPKKFKYTTEPLKSCPADIQRTPLLHAQVFHFLATPEEVSEQIPQLISSRQECGITERPTIVWEPFPASCNPDDRPKFLEACRLVDVFSPNHFEMTALFVRETSHMFQPDKLQTYAQHFLDSGVGPLGRGCVVIRAAEHGCLISSRTEACTWLPAFYAPNASQVIDTTGAGNTFFGGFSLGLQASAGLVEAAVYGNVAASFAMEQIGLPSRALYGEKEMWNDSDVLSRLEECRARL
ncbi:MAG: hypothetical protein Q9222_004707 [Ikaeria aurantiellina]